MAVTITKLTLTDDHTSRTAAEVLSSLQLDQGSPDAKQKCDMLLRDLDFPSEHQNEEDYSQFVLNSRCLILGDSRVGKTSLVKSLTKKPFDVEEPSTFGVHTNSVDREWQSASLAFGSFSRFGKSVRSLTALISSKGYVAFEEVYVTSKVSFYVIWSLYLFLLVLLWQLEDPDILVIVTHIAIFFGTPPPCSLQCPFHFTIGLMFAQLVGGVFRGINCGLVGLSCVGHLTSIYYKFIVYIVRLFYLSPLTGKCIDYFLGPLKEEWLRSHFERYQDNIEIPLPGQLKIYNCRQVIPPGLFYHVGSLINGIGLGFCADLLMDMSFLSHCEFLHYLTMLCFGLSVIWFIHSLCKGSHFIEGIVSPIISICVIENMLYGWRSSFSMLLYVAIFVGCACCAVISNRNFVSNFLTHSYKVVSVQKVTLNYPELKKALNAKFSHLTLGILDFGGDYNEHFAYHHLFYRNQTMYVVVFNLAHIAADNFYDIETKIRRICFWLESIHGRVAPKTPIFLVGTHRGNMSKACLGNLDKHLQQSLWQTYDLVMNEEDKLMYFPVENKYGIHDRGIKNLQRTMIHIAEEYQSVLGCTIPFSWIKIQDAIINSWKNHKAKFCVSLEHFPTSFSDFICSNWSKETFKYFHEKGLVIYIDKGENSVISKWVLLKPSLLVDITIQLITPRTDDELFSQHGFRREWTLLHNKGMLTNSLLRHILTRIQENEVAMTGFLEKYGIICPLFYSHHITNDMKEAKVTHFVPALLPVSANVNTPVWNDHPTDKRFYVFFEKFLPELLFHCLLSRAHQLSIESFRKGQTFISRNVGRFWLTPTQPCRLLHLKEENMIEVMFSHRCKATDMHPADVLVQVFGMVQGICQGHFPYTKFHCGPACPSERCPGYQQDYISHPGVQTSIPRRHVIHVLPSENSSFYCAYQNFESDLKEWRVLGGLRNEHA
ncbi:uncharacterized protein LOC111335354 isoform X1 [Stylophora pistillata]|uniref:Serine/threonine-protein kinase pats1 n=1 Tax=Stylophora pistillata TaxID=50429 RepID=A0A2B4RWT0_STYPI|nr:uncharacterized protein LOC111335354 isoform X1 [Stylophora pistillata]PFX21616.1 hypothetical protein AWC38_SpisGene13893 [Stylophora pistillata]